MADGTISPHRGQDEALNTGDSYPRGPTSPAQWQVFLEEVMHVTPKMLKMADDPCFGKKHDQLPQCGNCWIKNSCHVAYRNRK
jgi:hypothetical protein